MIVKVKNALPIVILMVFVISSCSSSKKTSSTKTNTKSTNTCPAYH